MLHKILLQYHISLAFRYLAKSRQTHGSMLWPYCLQIYIGIPMAMVPHKPLQAAGVCIQSVACCHAFSTDILGLVLSGRSRAVYVFSGEESQARRALAAPNTMCAAKTGC